MIRSYPGQEPGETIEQVFYKHWFALVPIAAASITLVILAVVLPIVTAPYLRLLPSGDTVVADFGLAMLAVSFFAILIFLIGFAVYLQNKLIVTSKHLVQIIQTGVFNRRVSQLNLLRVQDASGGEAGFFATIFHFGTVQIETAGEEENFDFGPVANPYDLSRRILEAHEQCAAASPVGAAIAD